MIRPLLLQLPTRSPAPPPSPAAFTAPTPIARLLVLAHAIERATESGTATRAQIARGLGLSRARLTQIANLAFLAPDVQAAIAEAERPIPERALRQLATEIDWDAQRSVAAGIIVERVGGTSGRLAARRPRA